jgi:gamma-glutamylcyclotransferase (GGCT)/AIG2-like uncharacterized protein YtfP
MKNLLFVYGTLQRGGQNHRELADQTFLGAARTVPGYRLHDLGGFPGIFAHAQDQVGVAGEVWSIDAATQRRLDLFEGVPQGLYRRERIRLLPPFADQAIEAYVPTVPVGNCPEIGNEWTERATA